MRSDVALAFPDYTKLPPKRVEDTRRVSAVQGTKLSFDLQLNKPVKTARLIARDPAKTAIDLRITPGQAVVFYRGDEVVGGAWIRESIPVAAGATAGEETTAAGAR